MNIQAWQPIIVLPLCHPIRVTSLLLHAAALSFQSKVPEILWQDCSCPRRQKEQLRLIGVLSNHIDLGLLDYKIQAAFYGSTLPQLSWPYKAGAALLIFAYFLARSFEVVAYGDLSWRKCIHHRSTTYRSVDIQLSRCQAIKFSFFALHLLAKEIGCFTSEF